MAESRRCRTKAFSVQPATMLAANSSTPVKAAKSAVGPASESDCSVAAACAASSSGRPSANCTSRASASIAGTTSPTLPSTAATCERTRLATSSTKSATAASVLMSRSRAAMAGAVIAGCLVASVRCSSWIATKLAAYIRPDQSPLQKADSASE